MSDGDYELAIVVDGFEFETSCTIAARAADASYQTNGCQPTSVATGTDRGLNVSAYNGGIWIEAYRSGLHDGDNDGSGGPQRLSVVVSSETAELAAEQFEPRYVRDRRFNGDPECGFCDHADPETIELTP